jgi:hypothetical protein
MAWGKLAHIRHPYQTTLIYLTSKPISYPSCCHAMHDPCHAKGWHVWQDTQVLSCPPEAPSAGGVLLAQERPQLLFLRCCHGA